VLTSAALEQLAQHPLKGNVRELENLLHRAVALSEGGELQFEPSNRPSELTGALTSSSPAPSSPVPLAPTAADPIPTDLQNHLDQQERDILVKALQETGFNRTAAAARLGLSLRQIRYRIARLNIETPQGNDAAP
jgi:two-component system response regulator PilR (NtrC family)